MAQFFFTWFLIPETKGISLEKMDALFGVVESPKLSGEEASIHSASKQVHETTADAIGSEKAPAAGHVERK